MINVLLFIIALPVIAIAALPVIGFAFAMIYGPINFARAMFLAPGYREFVLLNLGILKRDDFDDPRVSRIFASTLDGGISNMRRRLGDVQEGGAA